MTIIVQKYGGTSVGDITRIRAVAQRVAESSRGGAPVVVVLSAMSGWTDRLVGFCADIGDDNGRNGRERDAVISTGEQVSAGLLAMALAKLGVPAKSFTGEQAGILTDEFHGKARIVDIRTQALRAALEKGITPVVAGFQGCTPEGEITTLGRGGSDTTAVALAAALAARECQIFTDVDGIYTTDPRVCPKARRMPTILFEEMLEMASLGSKVLQLRSVEFAGKYRVPLRVLSSMGDNDDGGTLITYEYDNMEKPSVSGVAFNRAEAKITVAGVPDRPGIAHQLLSVVADANVNVDMIVQNVSTAGRTDFSFTVHRDEYGRAMEATRQAAAAVGAEKVIGDDGIGKVSVVGIGMKSHAGVASKMFRTLAENGVNIQMISTSEIKVSVVIEEKLLDKAICALHDAFQLEKPPQVE